MNIIRSRPTCTANCHFTQQIKIP